MVLCGTFHRCTIRIKHPRAYDEREPSVNPHCMPFLIPAGVSKALLTAVFLVYRKGYSCIEKQKGDAKSLEKVKKLQEEYKKELTKREEAKKKKLEELKQKEEAAKKKQEEAERKAKEKAAKKKKK